MTREVDMSEENGTISVLPFSRAGTREVTDHVKDPVLNDLVGYFGDDPGDPVIVPAGQHCCVFVGAAAPERPQPNFPPAAQLRRPVLARADPQAGRSGFRIGRAAAARRSKGWRDSCD